MDSESVVLDDTVSDFEYVKQLLPYCNFNELYNKNDLRVIYTDDKLSLFLGVSINTKTNIYTIINRIKIYIKNYNLCINGTIKPDEKLSSILISTHKYNRITHNTLLKYIMV